MESLNLLSTVVQAVLKHPRKSAAAFLGGMIVTALCIVSIKPVFESNATLQIRFGREYVYPAGRTSGRAGSPSREGLIAGEIEVLTSLELANQTVTEIGAGSLYPALAGEAPETELARMAAYKLQDSLSVRGKGDSGVIAVSLRHPDATICSTALNMLMESFRQRRKDVAGSSGVVEFLEQRVTDNSGKLARAEEAVEAFKKRLATPSVEDEESLLLRQRAELESLLNRLAGEIALARQKLEILHPLGESLPRETVVYAGADDSRIVETAMERLLDLRMTEQQLLGRLTPESAEVKRVRKEIEIVAAFLEKHRTKDRSVERIAESDVYRDWQQMLLDAQTTAPALEAQERALRKQLEGIQQRLAKLAESGKQEARLFRELALADANYRNYAARLEEARMFQQMDAEELTDIRVIQPPVSPAEPVGSRRKLRVLVGMVFSTFAAVGVALLAELYQKQLRVES